MEPDDVAFSSLTTLARGYATHELSPVEVTSTYLDRIARLDPSLGTYITVTAEAALVGARASESRWLAGRPLGILDGAPIGAKDIFDTAGVLTTGGSRLHADRIPTRDAPALRQLLDVGAILLGKHALHELAAGGPSANGTFPTTRNPWDRSRVPGGSSSGSGAAVAAGLCAAALGSDTGGSIRTPASLSGVVGIKPTYGVASCAGVEPLAWSLDHCGPLARSVADAAIVLDAMADPRHPRYLPDRYRQATKAALDMRSVRVGFPRTFVEDGPVEPEVLAACMQAIAALQHLGAQVTNIDFPTREEVVVVGRTILVAEAFAHHGPNARERSHLFGPKLYRMLLEGAMVPASDYLTAQRLRTRMRVQLQRTMSAVDLLILPTSLEPAWAFVPETSVTTLGLGRAAFTFPFNLTGQPAISLPWTYSTLGLPIAVQLAARPFEDAHLLAAAAALEPSAPAWAAPRRPPDI